MGLKPKWLNFGHLDFKVLMCRFLRLRTRYREREPARLATGV
ncbi:glutamate racemase/nucleoside 5-triphosphatase [Lacticaseibacillus paracasei]|nr:glutamate racemase/nucleoside 5-triphosphatase [Lacticaseibacillus paracasei]